jgi:hypothetical protein
LQQGGKGQALIAKDQGFPVAVTGFDLLDEGRQRQSLPRDQQAEIRTPPVIG